MACLVLGAVAMCMVMVSVPGRRGDVALPMQRLRPGELRPGRGGRRPGPRQTHERRPAGRRR